MKVLGFDYAAIKESSVTGRYVTNKEVLPFLATISSEFDVEEIGKSVLNKEIKSITLGTGKKKLLLWSQMHGNESTTTKAVLDLVNFLSQPSELSKLILKNCTIKIIPILNPDGAESYTRANANKVDLNRDAQNKSEIESKVLRNCYDSFQPDYCFNLHDQRTIFNVDDTDKPATLAFLAPSHDEERSISKTREVSMQIIAAMDMELQKVLPNQIARFDDGFNSNCIGDTFQMLNTPTILFEAGHYKEDYSREKTREFMFYAILKGIEVIAKDSIQQYSKTAYFSIPENNKLFFDVLIKNVNTLNKKYEEGESVGVLYKEVIEGGTIVFVPKIERKGKLEGYFGHKTFDCNKKDEFKSLKKVNLVLELLE
ncbi:MAG: M14 metallopeptidase family protein [Cellulophaga sp.]